LVQFYSEVLAFSFFVNSGSQKMLPVPWVLLGARSYLTGISGEATRAGTCGAIPSGDWLNSGIARSTASVQVGGRPATVVTSAFVAVASRGEAAGCPVSQAVNNKCPGQRQHLDADITLWYQAYESTMYDTSVQQAFSSVVGRIGTGPWGAGVWWGDSQQYFLAVWLATSLVGGASLDYYVYDRFCENAGNQCFVLGASGGCAACVARAAGPGSADHPVLASACGTKGLREVIAEYQGRSAAELYAALNTVAGPPSQVFDVLKAAVPLPSLPPAPEVTPTQPPDQVYEFMATMQTPAPEPVPQVFDILTVPEPTPAPEPAPEPAPALALRCGAVGPCWPTPWGGTAKPRPAPAAAGQLGQGWVSAARAAQGRPGPTHAPAGRRPWRRSP